MPYISDLFYRKIPGQDSFKKNLIFESSSADVWNTEINYSALIFAKHCKLENIDIFVW